MFRYTLPFLGPGPQSKVQRGLLLRVWGYNIGFPLLPISFATVHMQDTESPSDEAVAATLLTDEVLSDAFATPFLSARSCASP